jgi:UDPglucose 6-dehydrogenase
MDSNESEFVKYACNCFFATKVMYFNEIKLLADKMNLEWEIIMQGILSDGRISQSHANVPGHDGDNGFGGTCFPKDINAFIKTMENTGIEPMVMKSVWQQNKKVRKNWDWAKSESAVKKQGNNGK